MTQRRTLIGLALVVMALSLCMGCVEPGPPPPPPPMVEPPPPPPPSLYFVTVSGLALREGPTTAAPQIGTLDFNNEVQILETTDGWARVLEVGRGRTGWASMRYLQPMPADRPRSVPGAGRRLPRSRPLPPPPLRPCKAGFPEPARGWQPAGCNHFSELVRNSLTGALNRLFFSARTLKEIFPPPLIKGGNCSESFRKSPFEPGGFRGSFNQAQALVESIICSEE